jgi:exopolysaccharide biosynthesis protein
VDANGDLLMLDYGEVVSRKQVEDFVQEHDIRFSLAFGPILLRSGNRVEKFFYAVGETDGLYSRAALCQQGPLHYMLVVANRSGQNVSQFSRHLQEMGVQNAYMLDGGQTAVIVTGDERMNSVNYGSERKISDIIYFATAVPSGT